MKHGPGTDGFVRIVSQLVWAYPGFVDRLALSDLEISHDGC
jgi:hypothetical protein